MQKLPVKLIDIQILLSIKWLFLKSDFLLSNGIITHLKNHRLHKSSAEVKIQRIIGGKQISNFSSCIVKVRVLD